ncbi:MAG: glycosyltransferase family 39 protein [Candidatus Eisenbacteria bacterium]|nr:glycosyltransferase family 39 protein [Candidatus Eisenbacteria bacterium]
MKNPILSWRAWVPPVSVALLALLLVLPNLSGPTDRLYPLAGDALKYERTGRGLALFLSEPGTSLPALFRGFDQAALERYGLDEWIFQHTPTYSWSLAVTFWLSGGSVSAARALSACYFAAAAALLVLWARRHFGLKVALASGGLFLLWPAHLYFATALMTEVPMIFFALLAAYGLDATREDSRPIRVGLGGAALGLLVLSKTTFRVAALPLLVLDLWSFLAAAGKGGRWPRFLGVRLAGLLIALAPFYGFLGLSKMDPDPLRSAGDTEMWLYRGNYVPDQGFENIGIGDARTPELAKALDSVTELSKEEKRRPMYKAAFESTVRAHPVGMVALMLAKLRWFWTYPAWKQDLSFWFGTLPPPSRVQPLLALLALIGAAALLRRGPRGLLPAAIALYVAAVHGATHLVSRYNVPVVGLAFPYAMLVCFGLGHWMIAERQVLTTRFGAALRTFRAHPEAWAAGVSGLLALLVGRDQWRSLLAVSNDVAAALRLNLGLLALTLLGLALFRAGRHQRIPTVRLLLSLLLFPGLCAAVLWGERRSDPDGDRFVARLERVGDRIEQKITLPPNLRWEGIVGAEIAADLLPSVQPGYTLVARVNGHEAARFEPKLPSGSTDFELDRALFDQQDRWNRVLRSAERHYQNFVQRRHPGCGYEFFPQWYRIPFDPAWISGANEVTLELELAATSGGYVDCFGDAKVRALTGPNPGVEEDGAARGREVNAPAFLVNAYDLSNYRFDLFATDRLRADSRLTRPLRLESPASIGAYWRGGTRRADLSPAAGRQDGEYRLRLRLRNAGEWWRRTQDRKERMIFTARPRPDDSKPETADFRRMTMDRDTYFDGWRTF